MSTPLLDVVNLRVNFLHGKKRNNAVQGVDFSVYQGQTLCIVGESGCGKSVTASSILRLLPKSISEIETGQILFEGRDIVLMDEKAIREIRGNKISMIFQEPMTSLNPVYTIGDQMLEMLRSHQTLDRDVAWERCVKMLEKVEISDPKSRMKAYPHELSGGMRQRVMIAMALLSGPQLLIADEPTTALDVTIQAQILELLKALQKDTGTAILLITHDMGVVADMANWVMVMYAGEIVEYNSRDAIFSAPQHPYTEGLLKSIPKPGQDPNELLYTIEGSVPTGSNVPTGCRFSTRCPFALDLCRREKPPLDVQGDAKVRCWKHSKPEMFHHV